MILMFCYSQKQWRPAGADFYGPQRPTLGVNSER